jgi:hypothetical protein
MLCSTMKAPAKIKPTATGARAAFDGDGQRLSAMAQPPGAESVDQQRGWQEDRDGGNRRADEARHLPADQRDDQRAWSRGCTRDREDVGELAGRQPAVDLDRLDLDLADDRLAAAEGHQRQRSKGQQKGEQAVVHQPALLAR